MRRAARKSYKYTQNYPTERKDYPSGKDEHPPEKRPESREGKHDYKPVQGDPEEGGKIPPDEAERISSGDLPA